METNLVQKQLCSAWRDTGTWFSGGPGSVRFMVGLQVLGTLFQPKWFKGTGCDSYLPFCPYFPSLVSLEHEHLAGFTLAMPQPKVHQVNFCL